MAKKVLQIPQKLNFTINMLGFKGLMQTTLYVFYKDACVIVLFLFANFWAKKPGFGLSVVATY